MENYLVATVKPWNINAFQRNSCLLPGTFHLITEREQLTIEYLETINPRYIFFPHWLWKVPDEITSKYECVCFHMTDLPFGRGGSPLQNLISRGLKDTKLTALRMVSELDAGPVYSKLEMSLEGNAQNIFERVAELVYDLISYIIDSKSVPEQQRGDIVLFQRRKPENSVLPNSGEIEKLYDHIRMLDADSYPRAFLRYGEYLLEFSNASYSGVELLCQVNIKKVK